MRFIFNLFLRGLSRALFALLRLRYHIEVVGYKELVKQVKKREGLLFLSNHTSEMDGVILMGLLWNSFRPRTLITQGMYELPLVNWICRKVKAIAVPNFVLSSNSFKRGQWQRALAAMAKGLKGKENFLVYPSGRLKRQAKEQLSGASAVDDVLDKARAARVVLVRLTGLWGSLFSCAQEGQTPHLGLAFWRAFKIILKNGIFFAPRRQIKVEFELADTQALRGLSRLELNRELERWFNTPFKKGMEPLQRIPESRWSEKLPRVAGEEKTKRRGNSRLCARAMKIIEPKIQELMGEEKRQIKASDSLGTDLGLDSLDIAQLLALLETRFGVRGRSPEELTTVGSVVDLATGGGKIVEIDFPITKTAWLKESRRRPAPEFPEGQTLAEAFLRTCDRMGSAIACVDEVTGQMLTYKKLKLAALALARELRHYRARHLGVMLPSSAGAYVMLLACQLARKIPVLINWTVGPAHLDYIVRSMKLTHIFTSNRFLDIVQNVDFGPAEKHFVMLEDVKKQIGFGEKLQALALSRRGHRFILRWMRLRRVRGNDEAAVLFTSGTEGHPKAVPLSHTNILENQRAALKVLKLRKSDILYSILPPFHSFGFNVTGILPLLYGVRAVFSPNPLDSGRLLQGVGHWGITLFCSAPSFLQPILTMAKKKQLSSLRLVVTGAEAMPETVFKLMKRLTRAKHIEGYGMTECSPIVTVNSSGRREEGVGRPIPGTEVRIIDLETKEEKSLGEAGAVIVHGPQVFSGYLGRAKSPFVTFAKKKWYDSGDVGLIDTEGNLILTGRSKRIVKIGGEMISLAAIEQTLAGAAPSEGWDVPGNAPAFACFADESAERPKLILYTSAKLTKSAANAALKKGGMSNIGRISELRHIDHMPLTATGKIDYRAIEGA